LQKGTRATIREEQGPRARLQIRLPSSENRGEKVGGGSNKQGDAGVREPFCPRCGRGEPGKRARRVINFRASKRSKISYWLPKKKSSSYDGYSSECAGTRIPKQGRSEKETLTKPAGRDSQIRLEPPDNVFPRVLWHKGQRVNKTT